MMLRPQRLSAGDRVLLVAPAGPVSARRIEVARRRCRALRLEPVVAAAAAERRGYLAGTDAARAADVQRGFQDEDIAAVWAIRGGYGTMRILRRLDFAPLLRRPKPVIGFSDTTALHLALARARLVSFHGPHAGLAEFPDFAAQCMERVLFRPQPAGILPMAPDAPPPVTLVEGIAQGELAGGNLALLAALCGTDFAPRAEGKIVCLEDVDEPLYRVDRMLTQLALAGVMRGAAGVAFGQFTRMKTSASDPPLVHVLRDWALDLGIPAVSGLPFGHAAANWTLPFGVVARMDAAACTIELLEAAVE